MKAVDKVTGVAFHESPDLNLQNVTGCAFEFSLIFLLWISF